MTVKNELKEWFETLPLGQTKEIRAEIVNRCKITDPVWSNWLRGATRVPELAKDVLNDISWRESGRTIY